MMPHQLGRCRPYTSVVLLVGAVLIAAGGGCNGEVSSGGPGSTDGGGGGDGGSCTQADCAGLAAPALAKVCPDGTGVGATLCTRQADGRCNWDFPPCPGDAGPSCAPLGCFPQCPNGLLKDSRGCDTCQCAPAADSGGTAACATDADCPTGSICGFLRTAGCSATGQCFVPAGGPRCGIASTIGCGCNGSEVSIDPSCYSGLPTGYVRKPVLHDGTCTDAGSADAGGADAGSVEAGGCVSQQGGRCGGNTARPCTCATGLLCTPGDSGLPFGDVGGTCQ